jgi:hypothetical protein
MRHLILSGLLAVVLMVQTQYTLDNEVYVDFTLDGEAYEGVTYDDMHEIFNNACLEDIERTL